MRDNHIGDWGTQFGMLLLGWKTELNRDASTPIHSAKWSAFTNCARALHRRSSDARRRHGGELVKLQSGDEENLGIWREMKRLSQAQFDTIYGRLGVRFDVTLGESFYNP